MVNVPEGSGGTTSSPAELLVSTRRPHDRNDSGSNCMDPLEPVCDTLQIRALGNGLPDSLRTLTIVAVGRSTLRVMSWVAISSVKMHSRKATRPSFVVANTR